MQFEEEYFRNLKYSQRESLIRRHILENLKWGSRVANLNLLNGLGKTALDVGCAYGYAVDILDSLGYDAYGVDISDYSIKRAKKLYPADFLISDVQKELPFRKDYFNLVTCFEVIEHLAYPLRAIRNMFDACKGVMICTTPNRTVEKPIKKVVRDFDETHVNVKTKDEWEKYLENLNCSFFKIETFFDASLRVRDKLLFKSFKIPYFGLNLRILIRK
ncbi:MAG TPA: class I SAM-dependent methyltransferase [Acidobacteriota bacterium]|nr:class I SAM-dependent methyltransferase [Acidobacteriota bacterium]